jgi:hypothetical protein
MPDYEPLRAATADERVAATRLCNYQPAHLWVADKQGGGKVIITLPDLMAEGKAFAFDEGGQPLWTKVAYYPALLRAGDGYEATHEGVAMRIIAAWDGTWVPSITLPDGSHRIAEEHPYDSRAAIKGACDLADSYCLEMKLQVTAPSLRWGHTLG